MPNVIKPEKLNIRNHPEISEKFIQNMIADDPSIIGLGDLVLKDKERMQPRAGRLDLLLMDPETTRRYEVELQLGKTDESHIIRTIEYWDIERKRYPQFDHCAVIIAEDITSRFHNVINLFNRAIPMIAIQMNAYKYGDNIGLIFTKVLDELPLGVIEEDADEIDQPHVNREYWVKKTSPETMKVADQFLEIFNEQEPGHALEYLKGTVFVSKKGSTVPYVLLRPRKKGHVLLVLKLIKENDIDSMIEDNDLDGLEYNTRASRYRIRLRQEDVVTKKEAIKQLLAVAKERFDR